MKDTPIQEDPKRYLNEPAILLATWFGSGLLPKFPGTWGSLAALPFAWALHTFLGWQGLVLGTALAYSLGICASNRYVSRIGGDDPGAVVIDEVAGLWMTLIPAAYLVTMPDVLTYAIAFVLFRIADIAKPWPVSWADSQIKGGLGIMLDDLLAALYSGAGVILYLIYLRS